jgi:hypothetical protein
MSSTEIYLKARMLLRLAKKKWGRDLVSMYQPLLGEFSPATDSATPIPVMHKLETVNRLYLAIANGKCPMQCAFNCVIPSYKAQKTPWLQLSHLLLCCVVLCCVVLCCVVEDAMER